MFFTSKTAFYFWAALMSQPRVLFQFRDMLDIAELPQSEKYGGENQNYVTFRKSRNLFWGKRVRVIIPFHTSIFQLTQYQKHQIRNLVRVPNQI